MNNMDAENSSGSTDPPDFSNFKERLRNLYDEPEETPTDFINIEPEETPTDFINIEPEETPTDFINIEPEEESRSTWGSDFSNIEPEEVTITNDKGETFIISEERKKQYKNKLNIKSAEDFFVNILELDNIYTDILFIDHLLDTNTLSIERNLSDTGLVTDYTLRYYGGEFKTIGRVLTLEEMNLLRGNIMNDYDKYIGKKRAQKIKKGGVITAIGLTIIGLITGLSVGLTRKGNDLVHKSKWEKLKPAKPVSKHIIPWTDLTDATGRALIFTGRYLSYTDRWCRISGSKKTEEKKITYSIL